MGTVICWFHNDLRLADHPALASALDAGHAVVPAYVLDDEAAGDRAMGGASRWWLHHSLASLTRDLEALGSGLVLLKGRAEEQLSRLAAETEAKEVYSHYRHEPWARRQMDRVASALSGRTAIQLSHGTMLKPPGSVLTKAGTRMKVFTPFKRNLLDGPPPRPEVPRPRVMHSPAAWPKGASLESLGLLPGKPDWSGGLRSTWRVGEDAAASALDRFLADAVDGYAELRDVPSEQGTSRLSPHLHFGEISPITVFYRVKDASTSADAEKFISELVWREFAYELLDQAPHMPEEPLTEEFERFPWRRRGFGSDLDAWQKGLTGYPLVDAGMRELYETGWMHNRIRMVVASFLTKHLLIPWQEGERWFWDTLVDADLASNSANWQWSAGCGVDAHPYFRIFNPISQGRKFFAHGYVRRWVPEIAGRDDGALFNPVDGKGPADAGGSGYPLPLVGHAEGRDRAMSAYRWMKESKRA